MLDPKQKGRYSVGEVELIKQTFGGDNRVLNALRSLMWQFDLNEEQTKLVQFSPEVLTVLKKVFLPSVSMDIPLFQNVSLYQSLVTVREDNPLMSDLHIQANDILIQFIKQQFNELVTGDKGNAVVWATLPNELGVDQKEERLVNLMAYHNIGGYIEGRISSLQELANPAPEPTPEELKAKLEKDSSR